MDESTVGIGSRLIICKSGGAYSEENFDLTIEIMPDHYHAHCYYTRLEDRSSQIYDYDLPLGFFRDKTENELKEQLQSYGLIPMHMYRIVFGFSQDELGKLCDYDSRIIHCSERIKQ